MSNKNPFRKPAPSEEGQVTLAPPPPSPPPRSISGPSSQSAIPASSSHASFADTSAVPDIAEDDLPPPYTPAPNVGTGEETVGLGPLRPFQPPPTVPPPRRNPLQDSRPHSNWRPPPTGPDSGFRIPPESRLAPAPWQSQYQYRQRQSAGGGLLGALFDTVREITDAVSGVHDERMMISRNANAGAYGAPYPGTGSVYAPPPGPPPPRSVSAPPRSPPPAVPDDGSPTRTPVPGHPLLRNGNLLIYPKDYLCVKCRNTGYKNYDPSHPCRKCWDKYGKSYTGALTYTHWSPSQNDPRMQRPLPKFVPPHLASPNLGSSLGGTGAPDLFRCGLHPPPQHPHHSRSLSHPHSVHPVGSGPTYFIMDPLSPNPIPPAPHMTTVAPGDPRLGGRLCLRCCGTGTRTVLFIDLMTCDSCGGTGRIWT